jgi:hypothetical protein
MSNVKKMVGCATWNVVSKFNDFSVIFYRGVKLIFCGVLLVCNILKWMFGLIASLVKLQCATVILTKTALRGLNKVMVPLLYR